MTLETQVELTQLEQWEEANRMFRSGGIELCDKPTLTRYLLAITNQQINNQTIQHRDVIRGMWINHILLQKHIDDLDRKNDRLQRWFLAFAIASLIASAVQIAVALIPPSQPTATELQVRNRAV